MILVYWETLSGDGTAIEVKADRFWGVNVGW